MSRGHDLGKSDHLVAGGEQSQRSRDRYIHASPLGPNTKDPRCLRVFKASSPRRSRGLGRGENSPDTQPQIAFINRYRVCSFRAYHKTRR